MVVVVVVVAVRISMWYRISVRLFVAAGSLECARACVYNLKGRGAIEWDASEGRTVLSEGGEKVVDKVLAVNGTRVTHQRDSVRGGGRSCAKARVRVRAHAREMKRERKTLRGAKERLIARTLSLISTSDTCTPVLPSPDPTMLISSPFVPWTRPETLPSRPTVRTAPRTSLCVHQY